MKTTIVAKEGYWIARPKDAQRAIEEFGLKDPVFVMDGDNMIMLASNVPYKDYEEEVLNGGNECARFCECFVTRKGNTFVYWRDEEQDIDYITKLASSVKVVK